MLEMVSGLDISTTASGLWHAGESGVSNVKGVAVGASGVGAAALMFALKKQSGGKQEGTVQDGRVRRVESGYLGLREHNNKFYKLKNIKVKGQIVRREMRFFDLMEPGLRISPVPWFKYKLVNTQNDAVDLDFKDKRVLSKGGRLFDLSGGIVWGHILGFDENKERIPYKYSDKRGEVSVERLVFNAIMAAKSQAEVGKQITSLIEPVIWRKLYGTDDPVKESAGIFGVVKAETHDALLDLGAELRAVNLTVSPNVLDHYGNIGRTSIINPDNPGATGGESGLLSDDLIGIEQSLPGTIAHLRLVQPNEG